MDSLLVVFVEKYGLKSKLKDKTTVSLVVRIYVHLERMRRLTGFSYGRQFRLSVRW